MNQVLWNGLTKLDSKDFVAEFLNDILTSTERVMMTKRLAMAVLLLRGWDQEAISSYLKVSTSTVRGVKKVLKHGGDGYRKIVARIERDKEWEKIKLDLGQALEEIVAGRVGANWKTSKSAVARKYRELREKKKVL
ncbi:hypothetical protein A2721_02545 [Candidatus Gottesmanbacteria bacterium RIFCSPHIGHO2_01_FULL_47_48]|uniref:TrpR like protein, YerC/YecD n=1 Tax=Candidatus Gottesmanbacteria bacterium RIFCSPHIGHO2_01_FULL_47_48 TaxID=1798381 RepID=A0A1F6A3X3_9BACT|nr:MAG: hypothetical protein A2721_02545 [Candidatus Gottesmanbacteria bacterium RIFCSPHIGHO2_01_FULL_47_48]